MQSKSNQKFENSSFELVEIKPEIWKIKKASNESQVPQMHNLNNIWSWQKIKLHKDKIKLFVLAVQINFVWYKIDQPQVVDHCFSFDAFFQPSVKTNPLNIRISNFLSRRAYQPVLDTNRVLINVNSDHRFHDTLQLFSFQLLIFNNLF